MSSDADRPKSSRQRHLAGRLRQREPASVEASAPVTVRRWMINAAVFADVVVMVAAFIISFVALSDMGVRIGMAPKISFLAPVAIDVAIILFTLAAIGLEPWGWRATWFSWFMLVVASLISLVANAFHAVLVTAGTGFPPVAAAVGASVFPLMLVAATHVLVSLLKKRPPPPGSVATVVAEAEPVAEPARDEPVAVPRRVEAVRPREVARPRPAVVRPQAAPAVVQEDRARPAAEPMAAVSLADAVPLRSRVSSDIADKMILATRMVAVNRSTLDEAALDLNVSTSTIRSWKRKVEDEARRLNVDVADLVSEYPEVTLEAV